MASVTLDQAALEDLLRDALSDGHHVGRGDKDAVIMVAVARAVAGVMAKRNDLTGVEAKLLVQRGLAAMLYAGEQKALAELDEVREEAVDRIGCLRGALDGVRRMLRARAAYGRLCPLDHDAINEFIQAALDQDERADLDRIDREAADERAPTSDHAPAPGGAEPGHVLRAEAGEPSHLGECEKCGRSNVASGEPCPAEKEP